MLATNQPVFADTPYLPTTGTGNVYAQPTPISMPKVVTTAGGPQQPTELPKTGLPLVAWALAGLLPAGFKIKGKRAQKSSISANNIWEQRQFKS